MSLPPIAFAVLALLAVSYLRYGGWLARRYRLDDATPTPAVTRNDGVDYVPTRRFYLLGQHFSAIAAAGPVAGPILAAQQFGWLPCLLWIALGVVLIGSVHDFSILIASVRHEGRSIAEIVRLRLGERAGIAMMVFIWVALVYVIIAFADITASTFVGRTRDLEGMTFAFDLGGAVAMASILYLTLSIVMGLVERFVAPPLWLSTLVFVPATLGVVWLSTHLSTVFLLGSKSWGALILGYCFVASLLPVWALLQPRGYLGGFVLYLSLAVGILGIFFGGFPIREASFVTWDAPGATGALFPFLFVTIACGACSGFHGLVCSGTTSKQIEREPDCRPVGYGGMLLEGFVALIALSTVMIADPGSLAGKAPGTIYGEGLGRYLTVAIGPEHVLFATTFGAMAFSTFVFDTLDVSTRLGRYILQELFGWRSRSGAVAATAITVALPLAVILASEEGAYRLFWTLFGTSNQLLAGLSLLAVWVWLKRSEGRGGFAFLPMVFVLGMTLWSLALQVRSAWTSVGTAGPHLDAATVNGAVALLLMALALILVAEAARTLRAASAEPARRVA